MSVTIKQIEWAKIGSIASPFEASVLRFISVNNFGGAIAFFGDVLNNADYKKFNFYYDDNTKQFSSITDYSRTIPNGQKALPIQYGEFYQTDAGLFISTKEGPVTTILKKVDSGFGYYEQNTVSDFDGVQNFVAYSYHYQFTGSTGGADKKYFTFGPVTLPWYAGSPNRALVETGFVGKVCISKNGLFAAVGGVVSGQRILQVYTTQSGYSTNTVAIQVGENVAIPGSETIESIKINNAGTRLVVYTFSTIYTYVFEEGSWFSCPNLSTPQSTNSKNIAISSDGSILTVRVDSVVNSYSWNNGFNSWDLQDVTNIFFPNAVDISEDAKFMAVDMWPTTNSTAIEIYKSTITEVTYDAPVITPGQTFTLPENRVFSGTPAVLNDGLNRQVTSWSASGLPPGLSINSSTGAITGTPTAEGEFTATITATGPGGSSTETIGFSVVDNFPLYRGVTRGLAVYAGASEGKAIYYGSKLLWNVAGWEPSTLTNNLLAFYRLNDAGGGALSLLDTSGNNRTLTNTGGVSLGTGIISGAASFQSTRYLSAAIPFNTAENWAISFWANISSLKNYFTLIGGESLGRLHIHGDSSGRLSLNNGYSDVSISNFFVAGKWDHYAFSRSGSTLSVYKNSTLVNTYTMTASYTATSTIYLGRIVFTGDDFQFVGRMDAVGLWSRALTSTEVAQLYNNGSGLEI